MFKNTDHKYLETRVSSLKDKFLKDLSSKSKTQITGTWRLMFQV